MVTHEAIELPSDQPLLITAGSAVALWGITLLASSVPSLFSLGSPSRSMRLGSMGIRVAAALFGLTSGSDPTMMSFLFSVGVVFAFSVEFLLGSWLRWHPGKQEYTKLSVEDDVDNEKTTGDDAVSSGTSGLAAVLAADPPPTPSPPALSPVMHGLAVVSSAIYFSFLRGLQLGSDIYVLGGVELDVDIACIVGQAALLGGATSVALQDTKGLGVETSALVLLLFAFAAPAGLVVGSFLAAKYDERSREVAALHHRTDPVRGHGPPVSIDPHMQLQRGSVGLGYRLGMLSTVVGGALLYQTLAAVLPREQRDADAEWAHKYASHNDRPARRDLHPLLGGEWSATDISYAKLQMGRFVAFVLAWTSMMLLQWPGVAGRFA
mmetsp:Transcript_55404/g.95511  ORF Transcript_55404/g.95511 Transcript_55404/m.95511 type:complete len:379 (-) Transcript_55404:246-1382(-)